LGLGSEVCGLEESSQHAHKRNHRVGVATIDRSKIGKPYILDYAKIGTGPTFVQRVISLILLTSDFSFDLMQGSVQPKEIRVLKAWGEAKTTTISRIAQKFLECRRCSPSEKRSLGVHRDRSIRKKWR
jgi:hypothetical protein